VTRSAGKRVRQPPALFSVKGNEERDMRIWAKLFAVAMMWLPAPG
jgi:hypothetical protein